METPYDWLTIIVFAGLIVLFLQRSQGTPRDHLWQYLVAAVGCAVTNYLGNEAIKQGDWIYHAGAIALGVSTLAFIWFILQPFSNDHS
jgi:drug/metabolite transporter (DMT)-like permease